MEITGFLHSHSTYSYDGKLSLKALREECLARGLRFVCMTEHTDELDLDRARAFVEECAQLSDEGFVFIPGFEVPYKDAHVLMIGCPTFHGQFARTSEELLRWAGSASMVVLAHPVRNKFIVDETLLKCIDGVEVWNQQYEGKRAPRVRSLRLLTELRLQKPLLRATGGVDLHRKDHFGGPYTTLDVARVEHDAIIAMLREGAYRVQSGAIQFSGTLPDVDRCIRESRIPSSLSIAIVGCGKATNALLARFGIGLPKSIRSAIRSRV